MIVFDIIVIKSLIYWLFEISFSYINEQIQLAFLIWQSFGQMKGKETVEDFPSWGPVWDQNFLWQINNCRFKRQ